MKKICPSITELQAFEASARHASFTKAAGELFITQGAVSRQVANLETYLGTPLFMRQNNRLNLTEAGVFFLEHTQTALRILVDASGHLASGRGRKQDVTISVPPTLATHVLMPLLAEFYCLHPSIRLHFAPYEHLHDFVQCDHLDVAIQFGEGEWPGAVSRYLIGKEQAVICTPEYAKKCSLTTPSRLQHATLLQHLNVPHAWVQWFQANKLPGTTAHLGPSFGQYDMIIAAAKHGLGAGLVPRCLVANALRNHELFEPVVTTDPGRQGYFLCVRKTRSTTNVVTTFVDWLTQVDLST